MDNFSIQVDDNFLATLHPDLRDDLTKDIEEYSDKPGIIQTFHGIYQK